MTEVFHIVPATVRWGVTLTLIALPLLLVLGVLSAIGYSIFVASHNSTFELSNAGLRLRGDFYGQTIPLAQLKPSDTRLVSITDGPYRPVSRSNGIAVPGYRAGWFRLRNGRKALLYVTSPDRVVLVPTTRDYDVLLSVVEAERFVARLHALDAGARTTAGSLP
jgi:hypothetical protein